jgi:methyl-accepting chemotaxis protein
MTDIPKGYTTITLGLGDATPKSLLIIPMKYTEEVQAILEIASFTVYEPYQVEFLEKIGEFVASAVTTAQTNEMTKRLLMDAQHMAEEMRAQEEEMRQNMEELSATQEEMTHKEQEYLKTIQQLEVDR